jgi:hypothetical protein
MEAQTTTNQLPAGTTPSTMERYKGAPWYKEIRDITVIGLGGVGFGTALQLKNLEHKLTVFDRDTVELHNCRPQGFMPNQIGAPKTLSFIEKSELDYGDTSDIKIHTDHWKSGDELSPFVVFAADDMEINKIAFEEWYALEERELFLDGRLLAESFQCFAVTPENADRYRKTLFPDEEGTEGQCTFRQTRHIATILHGILTQLLLNHIQGIPVPFRIDFDGVLMSFKQEY